MYLLRWSHKYVDGRMPLSLSDSSQLMATFDKKKNEFFSSKCSIGKFIAVENALVKIF